MKEYPGRMMPWEDAERLHPALARMERARMKRRRRERAILIALAVFLFGTLAVAVFGMEGPDAMVKRGAYLFNTSRPACSSCHNRKHHSLDDYGSRGSMREAKEWIQHPNRQFEKHGKKGLMPAYKMPPQDIEALATYLMTLEE